MKACHASLPPIVRVFYCCCNISYCAFFFVRHNRSTTCNRGRCIVEREQINTTARGIGIANLVLGLWLIISPFLFGYESGAIANSVILGVIVAILAVIHLTAPNQSWTSWLNGVAGLWLIVAPFMLGFTSAAVLWNQIIVGVLVAGLGFWNGTMTAQVHTTHHHAA